MTRTWWAGQMDCSSQVLGLSNFSFIPTPSSKLRSMMSSFSSPHQQTVRKYVNTPCIPILELPMAGVLATPAHRIFLYGALSRCWCLHFTSKDETFWVTIINHGIEISIVLKDLAWLNAQNRTSSLWLHALVPYCLPSLASLLTYMMEIKN